VQSGGVEGAALFSISSKKNLKDIMEGLCSDCLRGCLAPLGLRDRVTMTRVNRHSREVLDLLPEGLWLSTLPPRQHAWGGRLLVSWVSEEARKIEYTARAQQYGSPVADLMVQAIEKKRLRTATLQLGGHLFYSEMSAQELSALITSEAARAKQLLRIKDSGKKRSAPVKDGSTSKKTKTECSHCWCRENFRPR